MKQPGIRRLGFFIAASLGLHALLVAGFAHVAWFEPWDESATPAPLAVTLVSVAPPRAAPLPTAPPPQSKPPRTHHARKAPAAPAPRAQSAPEPAAPGPEPETTTALAEIPIPAGPAPVQAPVQAPAQAPAKAPGTGPDTGAASGTGDASGAAENSDAPVEAAAPPALDGRPAESAHLRFLVVAKNPEKDPNQSLRGHGELDWHLDGGRYALDLNASAQFLFVSLNVLQSHSEGHIDPGGLAPDSYTEKPRNRAVLVTLFRRGQDSVGAGTTQLAALPEGTQDRLSVLMQLGALVRSNANLQRAGSEFHLTVADLKGQPVPWTFESLGMEPVQTGFGTIDAVHIRRVVPAQGNDRHIDVWIATDMGGYPARILYTEPSAAYIDLTLAKIE